VLSSGSRPSFLCAPLQERSLLKKLKGTGDGAVDIFFRQASWKHWGNTRVRGQVATHALVGADVGWHTRLIQGLFHPAMTVMIVLLDTVNVQVQQAWEEAFPFADKKALKAARLVGLKEHPQVGGWVGGYQKCASVHAKGYRANPLYQTCSRWRSCAAATEPSSPASWPPW